MRMKRSRKTDDDYSGGGGVGDSSETDSKKMRYNQHKYSANRVTDLLKRCLHKVCELQADLAKERDSDDEDLAETAGYSACTIETLRFLEAEGLPPDHPVVKGLSQKLLKQGNEQ